MQSGLSLDHRGKSHQTAGTSTPTDSRISSPSPGSSSSSATSSSSAVNLSLPTHRNLHPRMRPSKINILSRGGSYSPLENGGGARSSGRRFGWKSVVLVAGIFVGALWMVGPRDTYNK